MCGTQGRSHPGTAHREESLDKETLFPCHYGKTALCATIRRSGEPEKKNTRHVSITSHLSWGMFQKILHSQELGKVLV
jgi:hypothetical protein